MRTHCLLCNSPVYDDDGVHVALTIRTSMRPLTVDGRFCVHCAHTRLLTLAHVLDLARHRYERTTPLEAHV